MCFVCNSNMRPRCKCVRFHLYNLKPETFPPPYYQQRKGRSRPDSIWGEVVDHESVSQFGNRFDIRLKVRTQNGSVVRKSQMLLYLPFQLQFHIITQTFLDRITFSDFFLYIYIYFFSASTSFHFPINLYGCTSISSHETQTNYTYRMFYSNSWRWGRLKKRTNSDLISFSTFYEIKFLSRQ